MSYHPMSPRLQARCVQLATCELPETIHGSTRFAGRMLGIVALLEREGLAGEPDYGTPLVDLARGAWESALDDPAACPSEDAGEILRPLGLDGDLSREFAEWAVPNGFQASSTPSAQG